MPAEKNWLGVRIRNSLTGKFPYYSQYGAGTGTLMRKKFLFYPQSLSALSLA
jgi:hypothetical protein